MRLRGCIQALLADLIFHGLSLLGLTHLCMTRDLSVLSNGETAVNLSRFFLFWYRLGQVFKGAEDRHVSPVAVHLHGWFWLPCEEEKEVLEFCAAEDSSPIDYCPPCPSLNLSSCLRFFLSCFFVFED